MNARGLRRYVEDLLRGRRPKGFTPDDFEAAQMRTAIDLTVTGADADAPRDEFLGDLHRRLAAQLDETAPAMPGPTWLSANRRQVIVGTSAAATAAVAGASVGRFLPRRQRIRRIRRRRLAGPHALRRIVATRCGER